MILKSLSLENIRSYEDQTTINFPIGTSLFEGDIGSGKSTLLMAIEFALFGLGNQKGPSLLRSNAEKGSVILEFESNGKKYEIERTLIRKGDEGSVRQDTGILSINGSISRLSSSELKERILSILNFKEPINPRAESVVFRYAIYTPQEEMKYILSQKPDVRLRTLRKAFGIEDYKIATENAGLISKYIKSKINYFSGQIADLREKKKELTDLKKKKLDNENEITKWDKIKKDKEIKITEQKKELEKLKKKELELKEIKAKIPHLIKQIEDKTQLSQKYDEEIQNAEEENKIRLIPQIKKLEGIKRPTAETEDHLNNKISYLKKNLETRTGFVAKLNLLNESKKNIEEELGSEKSKGLNELENEEKSLFSEIEKQNNLIKFHNEELKKVSGRIYKFKAKKAEINEKLENLDGVGDLCPICDTPLDYKVKQDLKNKREKEIQDIDLEIQKSEKIELKKQNEIKLIDLKLKSIQDKTENLKFLKDKVSRLNEVKTKINFLHGKLKSLNENLLFAIDGSLEFDKVEDYINYFETILRSLKEFKKNQENLKNFRYYFERNVNKIKENEKDIKSLNYEICYLKEDLSKSQKKSNEIGNILNEVKKLEEGHKKIIQEDHLINDNIISLKTLIKTLQEDMLKILGEIEKKEKIKKQMDKINDYYLWLNEYLIPTLDLIEKHVMHKRFEEFNENFKKWFELLIDDETKTVRIDEEFTPIIEQDNFEQEINYLSGGEKTSVALAYRLALNNIVKNVSTGMESNLLILDEPTDGFSKEQLYKVRDILNELNCPQIILVSHERELESFADHIFRVEKVDGISKVISIG